MFFIFFLKFSNSSYLNFCFKLWVVEFYSLLCFSKSCSHRWLPKMWFLLNSLWNWEITVFQIITSSFILWDIRDFSFMLLSINFLLTDNPLSAKLCPWKRTKINLQICQSSFLSDIYLLFKERINAIFLKIKSKKLLMIFLKSNL